MLSHAYVAASGFLYLVIAQGRMKAHFSDALQSCPQTAFSAFKAGQKGTSNNTVTLNEFCCHKRIV